MHSFSHFTSYAVYRGKRRALLGALLFAACLASTNLSAALTSQNYSIDANTLDAGGGHSEAALYSNEGSLDAFSSSAFSNSAGPSITPGFIAQITDVTVLVDPAGFTILTQPVDVDFVTGATPVLSLLTSPGADDVISTTYELLSLQNGVFATTGIGGIVSANGALEVPLRSLNTTATTFKVRLTRSFQSAPSLQIDSRWFTLERHAWEEAKGTYEALLADANPSGPLSDGALARGLLTLTVSKTGAVSGRVLFVESGSLSGAPVPTRVYTPVTRSFSGSLAPSGSDPAKLVCTPKLGSGVQSTRQELGLEIDFSTSPPTLSALVKDYISVRDSSTTCSLSRAENCAPSATASPTAPAALTGRYILSSNASSNSSSDASADNNAYFLVQILSSGRALWTSRLTGYSGSGSAGLNLHDPAAPSAPVFESRYAVSSSLLNTTALLGRLSWNYDPASGWQAAISSATSQNALEKQSSYLSGSKTGSVFVPKYTDSAHFSGTRLISFSDLNDMRWTNASLSTLFPQPNVQTLTVTDPLQAGAAGVYSWNITVSAAGLVRATGMPNAGLLPPLLSLRIDRTRGEWIGSYAVSKSVRRTLCGTLLDLPGVRGRGWAEATVQSTVTTGRWEIGSPQ